MMRAALALALVFPTVCSAATFTTSGPVLQPGSDGTDFWENGVGSPTLTYDSTNSEWVMLFETKFTDTWVSNNLTGDYSDCGAVWGVGVARASSLSGSWTVDADPLLVPERDTYYECRVTHPKIVKDGSTWYVFFKANQDQNQCDVSTPPWGCKAQTGVGVASLTDLGSPSPSFTSSPVLNVSGFGFPSAVKLGSTWHLWVAKLPDLYVATRTGAPTSAFTLDPTAVLVPGSNKWAISRVSNPGTTCVDGSRFPFQQLLGGKTVTPPNTVTASGIGEGASMDGDEWFLAADADFSWSDDSGWRGWDLHRFTGDPGCDQGFGEQYLAPYASKDSNGENEIYFAHTQALSSYSPSSFSHKVCSDAATSLEAMGQTLGADPSDNEFSGFDYEEGGSMEPGQGCSSSPVVPATLLALLPAAALLRRRREDA